MKKSSSAPSAMQLPVRTAPAPVAAPAAGFYRLPQVLALVPVSKSTLWRRVKAGSFPQPVKLSERVTVWRAEEVRKWIDAQGNS